MKMHSNNSEGKSCLKALGVATFMGTFFTIPILLDLEGFFTKIDWNGAIANFVIFFIIGLIIGGYTPPLR